MITEAGFLTYPEDASTDELNTIISRKGNRTRRPGIDYEDDFVLSDVDLSAEKATNEFVWISANKNSASNFLVIQIGYMVHFWSMDSIPVSDNKKSFTLDLRSYKPPTSADLEITTHYAAFDGGAGFLFIAHPYVEPLCVEYDNVTDTFTVIKVVVQVRDLEGIYDGLANDQEPANLSIEHHYNLLNQGWLNPGTIPTPALAAGETPPTSGTPGSTPPVGGGGSSTYEDPYTGDSKPYQPGGGHSGWHVSYE